MLRLIPLAVACIAISQPAEALVYATFNARVSSLYNYQGDFGPVALGDELTFSFVYDPEKNPGGYTSQYWPLSVHDGNGVNNPVTGSVQINGQSYGVGDYGRVSWGIFPIQNPHTETFAMQARGTLGSDYNFAIFTSVYGDSIPNAFNPLLPVSYTVQPAGLTFAEVNFDNLHTGAHSQIDLKITDFVTLNDGPVPEPAIWSMMITGFGLLGAAARRRGSECAAMT